MWWCAGKVVRASAKDPWKVLKDANDFEPRRLFTPTQFLTVCAGSRCLSTPLLHSSQTARAGSDTCPKRNCTQLRLILVYGKQEGRIHHHNKNIRDDRCPSSSMSHVKCVLSQPTPSHIHQLIMLAPLTPLVQQQFHPWVIPEVCVEA